MLCQNYLTNKVMEQLKFIGKNLTKERLEQAENKVLDDIISSGDKVL